MKTKILSLCVALLATTALWAYDFQYNELYYTITGNAGEVEVARGDYSLLTSVIIPSSVEYNGTTYSVTGIANNAFHSCSGLTSVTIGNNVRNIGNNAFYKCSGLTSIIIPENVTGMGSGVFWGCTELTSVVWNPKVCNGWSSNNNPFRGIASQITSFVFGEKVESVPAYLCYEMGNLTSITIPESVTSIGNSAFYKCSELTSVTIGSNVTSIGSSVFSGCTGITTVVWNAKQCSKSISLFSSACTNITSFIFGSEVELIPSGLCSGMVSLMSIAIPESVTYIGSSAFSNVPNIVYFGTAKGSPWGAKSMNGYVDGYWVYADVSKTKLLACSAVAMGEITIPGSVTVIGNNAFQNCNGLTSVTIGNNVATIGNNAFQNCKGLISVTIGSSVKSIGNSAFYNCSEIASITIPNNVDSIGSQAFYNCINLATINMGNHVTVIGQNAFKNTSWMNNQPDGVIYAGTICMGYKGTMPDNTILSIKEGTTSIANNAFYNCERLSSIILPQSVTIIGNNAFQNCSGLSSIVIPDNVTTIGSSAFSGCSGLTSVVIPSNITTINNNTFYNCSSLSSIVIPDNVTTIGSSAFSGCSGLTSVTISNTVTSIGNSAFNKVPNITYSGTATGSPWGANFMNGYMEGYLLYTDATKTTLLSCSNAAIGEIIIPESVTCIENNAFCNCSHITFIVIPESVTSIGSSAFSGCTELTSITLPTNITIIRHNTFEGCTNLATITIPNNVTSIGSGAFSGCTSITSIAIPNSVTSISSSAFDNVANIVYSGTATGSPWGAKSMNGYIEGYLVYEDSTKTVLLACSSAAKGEITIPESVTSIGNRAFDNCIGIISVTIPEGVTSIRNSTFYNCSSLTSITIPEGVTSIGSGAFYGCTSLSSIIIPSSVSEIITNTNGSYCAFDNCSNLTSVVWNSKKCRSSNSPFKNIATQIISFRFGDEVDSIPANLCNGMKNITSITIPNSVTSIGNNAFSGCTGLISATIGNNVASIGNNAFQNCSGLISIAIPESVTSIGNNAFSGCTGLISVIIGNNVTSIGDYAFRNCRGLTSIVIPESVVSIGNSAFYKCSGLTSVTVGNNVVSIGSSAFSGCTGFRSVIIGSNVASIGNSAFQDCASLTTVEIKNNGTHIGKDAFKNTPWLNNKPNGVIYVGTICMGYNGTMPDNTTISIKEGTTIIAEYAFGGSNALASIVIPESVTEISNYAFQNCSGLTSITIGNNVASIGNSAFLGCIGLTSIVIPESVTSIGYSAFNNCSGLTSVTIGNNVVSIDSYAFLGCTGLISVVIPESVASIGYNAFQNCSGLTSITIGNNVASIGNYAFSGCIGLTSIVIPESVASIGYNAFQNCNGLTSITIPTNVTTVGSSAFSGCKSLTSVTWNAKHCADGRSTSNNPFYNIRTQFTSFTFGADVDTIPDYLCYGMTGLTSITMKATTPPYVGSNSFNNAPTDIPVYIPCGALAAYTTDDAWNQFTNYQESDLPTLTITTQDEQMGSVLISKYNTCSDLQAVFSATPNEHYHFTRWNDDNTDNPRTVTVTDDATYTAEFAIDTHTIITAAENGIIVGGGTYDYNAQITLSATPDEGYSFTRWSDGNTDNPRTIIVTDDASYTAEFSINHYTITTNAENGIVVGGGTYKYNTQTWLSVVAKSGYRFIRWNDGNTDNPRAITVTADATYTAEIVALHTITTTATNGTVSGAGTYTHGAEVILSAIPDEHYHFTRWNDGNTDNPRTVTVTDDVTYTAEFTIDTHTIATNAENGTVMGGGTYDYGTPITLSVTPDEGYSFIRWSDGNTDNPRTITVTDDATYIAEFSINSYTITTSAAANGTITGAGIYNYGTQAILSAIPDQGYSFIHWSDGNTENPRTITVTADATYTAEFSINSYTITTNAENGTIMGGGTYDYGTPITLSVTPDEGYSFIRWSDGNTDNPRTVVVTDDAIYTAEFEINMYTVMVNCKSEEGLITYTTEEGSTLTGGIYPYGTQMTLVAIPMEGYTFKQWSDGVLDNPYIFTVVEDVTLTALFSALIGTEVDNTAAGGALQVQKVLRNGQVYIIRGGKTYTIMGSEVVLHE